MDNDNYPVGWFHIDLQLRTMAWFPFWWFNTLSWTIVDGNGFIVESGWGRRTTVYADANVALAREYAKPPGPPDGAAAGGWEK